MPRIQINTQIESITFAKNQIHDGTKSSTASGADHPPRNSVVPSPEIDKHAQVLAEEEQRKLESRILGEVAGHQFRLALRQIERRPIGLRSRRNGKHHKRRANPRA